VAQKKGGLIEKIANGAKRNGAILSSCHYNDTEKNCHSSFIAILSTLSDIYILNDKEGL